MATTKAKDGKKFDKLNTPKATKGGKTTKKK